MRGLFRGMTPRVIQTAPTMSIMMIVYDGINRFILHKQGHVDVSLSCVCSHALSGVCSHTLLIFVHTLFLVFVRTLFLVFVHTLFLAFVHKQRHIRGRIIFRISPHLGHLKVCD